LGFWCSCVNRRSGSPSSGLSSAQYLQKTGRAREKYVGWVSSYRKTLVAQHCFPLAPRLSLLEVVCGSGTTFLSGLRRAIYLCQTRNFTCTQSGRLTFRRFPHFLTDRRADKFARDFNQ
jgi:hypothetical protein